jgi:integrase
VAEGLSAGSGVDPVGTLLQLRALRGGTGYVFRPERDVCDALSPATVTFRLRKALEAVGVQDLHLFSSHSLRRGAATHAIAAGISLRLLMVLGRWWSNSVLEYTYTSGRQAMAAARRMLRAVAAA